jgi:pyruvate/2-oxoglutarate/acetoin dehydrogenase E1 component
MRYVESLNRALHDLFSADPRVLLIGEDVVDPYGGAFKVSKGLSTKFPDRIITTPISEAAIVGLGTGLALRGMLPIVEIMFGDFLTLACDQIVNSAAKFRSIYNGKVSLPLVIRTPMGGRRGYGPTHSQTLEPMFFNVPELLIVAPSPLHDPGAQLARIVGQIDGPVLFIENKSLYPADVLGGEVTEFDVFHVDRLDHADYSGLHTMCVSIRGADASDVVLAAYGGMVPIVLEAMKILFVQDEIAARLYAPAVVKPLPLDFAGAIGREGRPVVVCEESPRYAGWGAELAAQIGEAHVDARPPVRIRRVGAKNTPIPCGREFEIQVLPQSGDIVSAVREVLDGR